MLSVALNNATLKSAIVEWFDNILSCSFDYFSDYLADICSKMSEE